MVAELRIDIAEVVGDGICVSVEDGQKIYELIKDAIEKDHRVVLSFANVTDLTSAFLNAAIGQLYGKFEEDVVQSKLSIENIHQEEIDILKRVVDRAKSYFKNPTPFIEAVNDLLGDKND